VDAQLALKHPNTDFAGSNACRDISTYFYAVASFVSNGLAICRLAVQEVVPDVEGCIVLE
jgi:hypothetical protein